MLTSLESRRKALGKKLSISVAQKALQNINMTELQPGMASDFENYFARAMQYAASLRNKVGHPDRHKFKGLVDSLLDKAAEAFRITDATLGELLVSTEDASDKAASLENT